MKKSGKLKIFLIIKVIEEKFNIGLNKLAEIKTRNSIIFLNLIILQKLLKISMLVILISRNFKQKIIKR